LEASNKIGKWMRKLVINSKNFHLCFGFCHEEMEPISFALNLDHHSDLCWPTKFSRSEIAQVPSQCLKTLSTSTFGALTPLCEEVWASLPDDERHTAQLLL
jgi:hypothetical protein